MRAEQNPVALSDLVALTFVVPASVASSAQVELAAVVDRHDRLASTLQSGDIDLATWDSSTFTAPFDINHRGDEIAWRLPRITRDDVRAVCWAVDSWSGNGRRLIAELLKDPRPTRTRDIAEKAGYTGGIPSAFRHVAGRLRSIDRAPCWYGDPTTAGHPRGQELRMDPSGEPYLVVRSVYEARYPDLIA